MRPGLEHFLKVTRSFWPGLFQCYDHHDLPRTNNALEQVFGAYRHHERRVTGRKGASPSTVLRVISDNYFCRLATTTSAGESVVRTACATVRS